MSFEERLESISVVSAIDWSDKANQYKGVELTVFPAGSDGEGATLATGNATFVGVMQTNPVEGLAGTVAVQGTTKAQAAAAIAINDDVSVDANGTFIPGAADNRVGIARTPAGAAGDIFSLLLIGPNS